MYFAFFSLIFKQNRLQNINTYKNACDYLNCAYTTREQKCSKKEKNTQIVDENFFGEKEENKNNFAKENN